MSGTLPPELRGPAHTALTLIDPRVPDAACRAALQAAAANPNQVIAVLMSIAQDIHTRAERVGALPPGTFVDRLRERLLGDLDDDDLIGYALNDAAPGETVNVLVTNMDRIPPAAFAAPTEPTRPPAQQADAGRNRPSADQGTPERSETLSAGFPGEGHPAGMSTPRVGDLAGAASLAGLAARLRAAREAEAAADTGDPAVWTDAEMDAVRIPDGQTPRRYPTTPPPSPSEALPLPTDTTPVFHPCNHPTKTGPCQLRSGHPSGPGLPGEQGHIGGAQ